MKTLIIYCSYLKHTQLGAVEDVSGTSKADEESGAQQQDRFFSKNANEAKYVTSDAVWWKVCSGPEALCVLRLHQCHFPMELYS